MMTVLKRHLKPFKRNQISIHQGKGATEQTLPDRHALSTLTQGDPAARTMNNYAKATPMANPIAEGSPDMLGE